MRPAADLTNAKELQTVTPAPKPAFEVVSVEAIESEQRFDGTSKARPRPSPPYEARGDTARSTGHPMPPAALTPRSTDPSAPLTPGRTTAARTSTTSGPGT